MRWEGREESKNVEDRRGKGGKVAIGGGGLIVVIIVAIISLLNNQPADQVLRQANQQLQQQAAQQARQQPEGGNEALIEQQSEAERFSKVVLKDTEDVWNALLPEAVGKQYIEPVLVLYDGDVTTQGCGGATSSVGPFYCPADMKVYLDLSFFEELQARFKAPGDFACAYVIAHEVGHHIQNLLGYSDEVQRLQSQARNRAEANQWSVRLELQADFLAGVWAHHAQATKNILESGDIGEAVRAAERIGDDTLQKEATGRVVPDAFTHGSSEQRVRWFKLGYKSGDFEQIKLAFELPYDQL